MKTTVPKRFHEFLDAINAAFKIGQTFTTYDAGMLLLDRGLVVNPATAINYASLTLRNLMLIQDDCPEAAQLRRINRRYRFVPGCEINHEDATT